ncbi:MAG TPA: tetratricopeptide repeat protein [Sedimenticola sp.]|nr:tetratricopeptide repeat protein [Sedimenticola sp.]
MKTHRTTTRVLALLLLISLPWIAAGKYPKTDTDFSLLPEYCKARYNRLPPGDVARWKRKLGRDFIHVHHMCAGLHTLNLAGRASSEKQKAELLNSAIGAFNYVQRNAAPTFILQPEVAYRKAQAYERLGQVPEALREYRRAISLNQGISRFYVDLARLQYRNGEKEAAVETLTQGQKKRPHSRLIKKYLDKYR